LIIRKQEKQFFLMRECARCTVVLVFFTALWPEKTERQQSDDRKAAEGGSAIETLWPVAEPDGVFTARQ
jgi:hypothetical protein